MSKSGTTASFVYNAEGLRVQKTVNSVVTNYTLHGKNIVHLTQGSNSLHFWYDAQNRPALVQFNGTKYAYIHNLQGDIVGLIDSRGTEVIKYIYDPWGKILSTTGSLASTVGTVQPFRYRGYVYDVETGLYYLRARYYNLTWNRFVNADEIISGNLYCYCKLNPILLSDKSGCYSSAYMETMYDYLSKRNEENTIDDYALATVNKDRVNIRINPTTDSESLCKINKYEGVLYIKKTPIYEYAEDDIPDVSFTINGERIWFAAKIFINDLVIEGFIRADCLYPIYGMDIQPVRSKTLYLRNDPSTKNNYKDKLEYDDMVTIMFRTKDESNEEWYYVLSEKGPGWVMARYIGFGG